MWAEDISRWKAFFIGFAGISTHIWKRYFERMQSLSTISSGERFSRTLWNASLCRKSIPKVSSTVIYWVSCQDSTSNDYRHSHHQVTLCRFLLLFLEYDHKLIELSMLKSPNLTQNREEKRSHYWLRSLQLLTSSNFLLLFIFPTPSRSYMWDWQHKHENISINQFLHMYCNMQNQVHYPTKNA